MTPRKEPENPFLSPYDPDTPVPVSQVSSKTEPGPISGFITIKPLPGVDVPPTAPVVPVPVDHSTRNSEMGKTLELARHFAHEVNNLLSVIIMNTEVMKYGPHLPENEENIASIAQASRVGAQLIQTFSQVVRGLEGFELKRADCSLSEMVHEIKKATLIGEDIITFLRADEIYADKLHFGRVLDNLIGNALKYAHPPVIVESHLDGDFVVVRVIDHGEGLGEDPESLFQMYAQGANSDLHRGTGVGLHYCRKICTEHGGSITARNRPSGRGAIFTIRIPQKGAVTVFPPKSPAK